MANAMHIAANLKLFLIDSYNCKISLKYFYKLNTYYLYNNKIECMLINSILFKTLHILKTIKSRFFVVQK